MISLVYRQKRNMAKIFQVIIFLLLFSTTSNSAQVFQWAKSIKSEGFDEGYDLATDLYGNTYVAGMIEFDTDFGNGVILQSAGIHDIFLAKYNSNGSLAWARRAGGKGGDKIQSLVLDGNGFIYVAGEFEDTCYWDTIMKVTHGNLGVNNMFVAKYDTSGSVYWVRNLGVGGQLHTRGYGVTCDAQGNVYACGGTKGDTYYDNTLLFTTAGDYDGTVVKFDSNGNFGWARRMGGTNSDKAYGIVSDNNGYIYVTGYFVGVADFSPTVSLTGAGHTDIFLAKYDTSGLLQWAKQAGDTGFDRGWDITQNINGEIIITGEFQTGHFGSNMAYSRGNMDMFVASYDINGNNLWVTSGGGVEDDIGRGVTHDASGNIFVVGDFADVGIFTPDTVTSNGYSDIFVTSYNSTGSILNWVRSAGGLDNDRGRGVGSDNSGSTVICGEFVDSTHFDTINLFGDTLLDIFVAKIVSGNYCSTQASVSTVNSCSGLCNGIAIAFSTGQSPFYYSWSTNPPQHTATASGLCQGSYSVTVSDANGCSSTAFVTLTDPPANQLATTFANATCAGACNGQATATATGNSPFTYNWTTNPPQSGSIASGLCQGTYAIITTDASGCTTTAQVTLTDPSSTQLSATTTAIGCSGSCDGSAIAAASGNSPFSYNWNTNPPQSGTTATGLCAGLYSVISTDANGCTAMHQVTLSNPAPVQLSATTTAISCSGICDGTAIATATGPGPFTYSWSTGTSQSTSSITGLCQGTYNVTATNTNGCTSTSVVTLTDPLPLQLNATVTNTGCIGCSDGFIEIFVSGGTGSYQYLWNNGNTSHILTNLSAGNYSACVTDDNNCSVCDSYTVLDPGSGINTPSKSSDFTVYPNPFTTFTTIKLNIPAIETTKVVLYSPTGQVVYQSSFTGNEFILSSNNISSGVYFLRLMNKHFDGMKMIPLYVSE